VLPLTLMKRATSCLLTRLKAVTRSEELCVSAVYLRRVPSDEWAPDNGEGCYDEIDCSTHLRGAWAASRAAGGRNRRSGCGRLRQHRHLVQLAPLPGTRPESVRGAQTCPRVVLGRRPRTLLQSGLWPDARDRGGLRQFRAGLRHRLRGAVVSRRTRAGGLLMVSASTGITWATLPAKRAAGADACRDARAAMVCRASARGVSLCLSVRLATGRWCPSPDGRITLSDVQGLWFSCSGGKGR
jgi:hypothetical protein